MRFFFYLIGDVVGASTSTNDVVLALGVLVFLMAISVVNAQRFRRDDVGGGPVGIALIFYGLLFAAATTQGRLKAGMAYASASRFTTFDLLILVGAYLALFGSPNQGEPPDRLRFKLPIPGPVHVKERSMNRSSAGQTVLVILRASLIVIICVQVAFGIENGLIGARADQATKRAAAHVFVNINEYSDYTLSGGFPLGFADGITAATNLRHLAEMAKAHHLNLFASTAEVNDAERAIPGDHTQPITRVLDPLRGNDLKGNQLLGASGSDEFRVTRVDFQLTGGGLRGALIGVGKSYYTGWNTEEWYTEWNTAGIPNGPYGLQSVLYDASGNVTYSIAVPVTVAN
jgi:hypothetical protein